MNLARGNKHWDATAMMADMNPAVEVIFDIAEL
jgi:hypothetical protein